MKYSVALGISDCSARRILHKDLNFQPYKMVVVQELSDHDMANRRTVTEHLIRILSDDVIILNTDEAFFHLSGCANKRNFRYWAEGDPQQLRHQRLLHSAHVTVSCSGKRPLFLWRWMIIKCMWNKMAFNAHSFCNNKLKIKLKFHCFI
jgi:hypothetical protein